MEKLLGSITMFFAITMVVIALPSQIHKNYQEKKCGLSLLMVVLPFAVYVSRACYAVLISSWYIAVPDFIGVILSALLLMQFCIYRKH